MAGTPTAVRIAWVEGTRSRGGREVCRELRSRAVVLTDATSAGATADAGLRVPSPTAAAAAAPVVARCCKQEAAVACTASLLPLGFLGLHVDLMWQGIQGFGPHFYISPGSASPCVQSTHGLIYRCTELTDVLV
ncbi:unnamed protein product [Rangifer tarandus platyrhynchus]|uniref:Uncharacterized protein n=2 Tax=Rangifer tarandus platyrhynchus TaxID=3082113 RepID=A0ABN8ZR53_RANTA|nr:unnamed protein product [Rangifer tarandus platyrhynchus]CAI9710023.1 unnamed protein product [Rangifer tarandus platyrhynchus]